MPCFLLSKAMNNARYAAVAIMLASFALLLSVYFFQYVMGLAPCVLCLYQRLPHMATFILGCVGFLITLRGGSDKRAAFVILLCVPVYIISVALGFYHTGVEQHWWRSALEACTSPAIALSGDDLAAQLEKTAAIRCDAVSWSLFGISMAGYNTIISFGLMVYCGVAATLITRKANGL